MHKTTKSEILTQLIKQKEPTICELVDENHSLRTKNHIAYTGLVLLTAISTLVGWDAIKSRSNLNKAQQENKDLSEKIVSFRKDATDLAFQNIDLKHYADDAKMLANSMKFYPDYPDSLTDLPDSALKNASEESEKMNIMAREKHEQTLKFLGVDTNLLYRVQQGPQIGD